MSNLKDEITEEEIEELQNRAMKGIGKIDFKKEMKEFDQLTLEECRNRLEYFNDYLKRLRIAVSTKIIIEAYKKDGFSGAYNIVENSIDVCF